MVAGGSNSLATDGLGTSGTVLGPSGLSMKRLRAVWF